MELLSLNVYNRLLQSFPFHQNKSVYDFHSEDILELIIIYNLYTLA